MQLFFQYFRSRMLFKFVYKALTKFNYIIFDIRFQKMISNRVAIDQFKDSDDILIEGLISSHKSSCRKRQIFYCQCGKKYMSFPALYVHARIKHNLKLSSSTKSQSWAIQQTDKMVKKKFFLKYGIENSQNNLPMHQTKQLNKPSNDSLSEQNIQAPNKVTLKNIFSKFLENIDQNSPERQVLICLEQFLQKKWGKALEKDDMGLIPYEFNSYAVEQLPKVLNSQIWSEVWKNSCQHLLAFGKWLYENEYTKFLVVENK